jgi:hypothetical protein
MEYPHIVNSRGGSPHGTREWDERLLVRVALMVVGLVVLATVGILVLASVLDGLATLTSLDGWWGLALVIGTAVAVGIYALVTR